MRARALAARERRTHKRMRDESPGLLLLLCAGITFNTAGMGQAPYWVAFIGGLTIFKMIRCLAFAMHALTHSHVLVHATCIPASHWNAMLMGATAHQDLTKQLRNV
jgi:hypothetical protein